MARKRYVSSDISTNRKLALIAEINPTAALMWPWFTTAFDDWGRMGADPVEVKLSLFPAFPFTSKEIADAIQLYDKYGLAHYYEVDGKPYLAINPEKWYEYQTYISEKRKKENGSKIPAPPNPPWEEKLQESTKNEESEVNFADNLQKSQNIVPSHSLSHLLSNNVCDGDINAREGMVFKVFEENFAIGLNPKIRDMIGSYLDDGMEPELIIRAIEITRQNGEGIPYLRGILNNCVDRGIKTLAAFEQFDREWKARKKRATNRGSPGKLPQFLRDQSYVPTNSDYNPEDDPEIKELLSQMETG